MKKLTFLLLGTLMVAGGLLVSCQKKSPPCKPAPHCHPHKPPPPCEPKKPAPDQHENPCGPCRKF